MNEVRNNQDQTKLHIVKQLFLQRLASRFQTDVVTMEAVFPLLPGIKALMQSECEKSTTTVYEIVDFLIDYYVHEYGDRIRQLVNEQERIKNDSLPDPTVLRKYFRSDTIEKFQSAFRSALQEGTLERVGEGEPERVRFHPRDVLPYFYGQKKTFYRILGFLAKKIRKGYYEINLEVLFYA